MTASFMTVPKIVWKVKPQIPDKQDFIPRYSCIVEDTIPADYRLDCYIADKLNLLSRSQIKARKMRAFVNGKEVKVSKIIKGGNKIELSWDDVNSEDIVPENIPLNIVFENERVVVINKKQGMVVHPGAGNFRGTLANALCYLMLQKNKSIDGVSGLRPGIVHRLDKDTSGLIITALDEEAHAFLADQFKNRKVIKTYAAIVRGCPPERGRIETFIARDKKNRKLFAVCHDRGKSSITCYKVVKKWKAHSLVLLRLKTGRTHQLRVHLKHIGHPILGDPLYGIADPLFPNASLMLHAKRLSVFLPDGSDQFSGTAKGAAKKRTDFRVPFPHRFKAVFSVLDKK